MVNLHTKENAALSPSAAFLFRKLVPWNIFSPQELSRCRRGAAVFLLNGTARRLF
jgi:hypothetical protein